MPRSEHRPDLIQALYDEVVSKGLPAQYHIGLEKALNPLRFTRIPGVTADLAQETFDRLVGDGVIDAFGLRLENLSDLWTYSPDLNGLVSPPGPDFNFGFFQAEVSRQLGVVWGVHVYSSEFTTEMIMFIESNLAAAETEPDELRQLPLPGFALFLMWILLLAAGVALSRSRRASR